MRSLFSSSILFLSASLCFGQQAADLIPPDAKTAMGELSKATFRAHMTFLADDLLEGRGPGKRGHEIAALYVAEQFAALGLKPAGTGGTYLPCTFSKASMPKTNSTPRHLTGTGFVRGTITPQMT